MENKDVFLLEEIIEYCDKISNTLEKHGHSRDSFDEDLDFQEACAFRVMQIGELVNDLSTKLKINHPEVEWQNIVAFRNIVTHD